MAVGTLMAGAFFLAGLEDAQAYSTDSIVSDPCHERITRRALGALRERLPDADRVEATDNEKALVDDAPFPIEGELKDLSAVSIILGNRDVDLRGNEPDDLDELVPIHGHPDRQDDHCLRAPEDDEPGGTEAALEACRRVIRQQALSALDGLADDGTVDPDERIEVEVFLDIRGTVDADLPRYHIEIGRALHTLQDGFSHTYRSADGMRVTTVLNFVDLVNTDEKIDPARDGPRHSSGLDACQDIDEFRRERVALAARASEDLLFATLDPDRSRQEKEAAIDEVIDRYFGFEPGCTPENDWCDAPEARYPKSRGPGCSVGFAGSEPAGGAGSLALLVLMGLRRRKLK